MVQGDTVCYMPISERFSQWRWERKLSREACGVPGCKDIICRMAEDEHRTCHRCKAPTAHKGLWIESKSLRRRMVPLCDPCRHWADTPGQDRLRAERSRLDWEKVTVPVSHQAIDTSRMEEQYPGVARRAIRAFLASDDEFATVTADIPAGAIQHSLKTLGLEDVIFAEQRDSTTVLRKIEK